MCPCHSGKEYKVCCEPFHLGKNPATPLLLMRSRYSAYAKKLPDYIIKTTHPENPRFSRSKEEILEFCRKTEFRNLKIIDSGEDTVTFFAELYQDGMNVSFTEKSLFKKLNGLWLYKEGHVT